MKIQQTLVLEACKYMIFVMRLATIIVTVVYLQVMYAVNLMPTNVQVGGIKAMNVLTIVKMIVLQKVVVPEEINIWGQMEIFVKVVV